jgi:F-type H+-transporting ATPase subunit delta
MARPTPAARRYAEAAFQVALRGGDTELDGWRDDLAMAADVLTHESVEPVIDSPAIARADRLTVVDKLLASRVRPGVLRLVSLLVGRGRAHEIARMSEQYQRLLNAHRGIVVATVTSATPLTDDETAEVRTRVEAMADAIVDMRTAVDPALLGGLTVQIGDRFLDASIRGRLERLRTQLNSGARPR